MDSVELLGRQYLQLLDPGRLAIPAPSALRSPQTQAKIYERLFDTSHVKYPPPASYQLRVLKRIIQAIEAAVEDPDEDEISDALSGHLATLIAEPTNAAVTAATQKCFVTYSALVSPRPWLKHAAHKVSAFEITLLEAPSLLASAGTTGFRTWEAALQLGRYLCSEHGASYVRDRAVVELGAGTGFLSLLCAKFLQARHVLATDGSIEVVNDIKQNMNLNDLGDQSSCEVTQLQWGHALCGSVLHHSNHDGVYDLAIGADVTYDPASMPALLATMRDIFELYPNIKVLIAATVRNEETISCFLRGCSDNAFDHCDLEVPVPRFDEQSALFLVNEPRVRIFLITKSSPSKDAFAI